MDPLDLLFVETLASTLHLCMYLVFVHLLVVIEIDVCDNIAWSISINSSRFSFVSSIETFEVLREESSVELHELTELLSISDSNDSIVDNWDMSPQIELNEVTKSTKSEQDKLLLLSLVTSSIWFVTVSMEDVIVCSFFIFALIISLVISVVDSNVLVVESEGDEVWVVLCEADVDAIVLVVDEGTLGVSEASTEGVKDVEELVGCSVGVCAIDVDVMVGLSVALLVKTIK